MSQQALERPLSGASAEAICYHYDVGTEFYLLWLDHNLTYSAARWDDPCRIAGERRWPQPTRKRAAGQ